jgi:hypothetical protein
LRFDFIRTALKDTPPSQVSVTEPSSPEQMNSVREIFLEYAGTLSVDLRFQGFERELQELPGEYSPPRGTLLLP